LSADLPQQVSVTGTKVSEQPSRLTVKVRLEAKPLHELPETTANTPAPFSLWRLGGATVLLFALAAAISWVWWQYRPDPLLDEATRLVSDPEAVTDPLPASVDATAVEIAAATVVSSEKAGTAGQVTPAAQNALVSIAPQVSATSPTVPQVSGSESALSAPATAADSATPDSAIPDSTAPHSPLKRPAAPYPAGFSRIVLTAHMRNLEPGRSVGELVPYPAVQRLYLFTELNGYAGQVIQHRWYYQNELKTTATLTIEDSPWRTYSENWLLDDQQGDWRVEIVDQRQQVLYQYSFSYR
jgi:hypothetical protein